MLKKRIKKEVFKCKNCTNSFEKDGILYCMTKIHSFERLGEYAKVDTAIECPWYNPKKENSEISE